MLVKNENTSNIIQQEQEQRKCWIPASDTTGYQCSVSFVPWGVFTTSFIPPFVCYFSQVVCCVKVVLLQVYERALGSKKITAYEMCTCPSEIDHCVQFSNISQKQQRNERSLRFPFRKETKNKYKVGFQQQQFKVECFQFCVMFSKLQLSLKVTWSSLQATQ